METILLLMPVKISEKNARWKFKMIFHHAPIVPTKQNRLNNNTKKVHLKTKLKENPYVRRVQSNLIKKLKSKEK